MTAAIALPVALLAYVASWIGWIINPGGQNRHEGEPWWVSLWSWHTDAFAWHSTLSAPHPYESDPLGWPLALRPTAMHIERSGGYVETISPLPNPLVTWGGAAAMCLLLWVVARAAKAALARRSAVPLRSPVVGVCAFVLVGYLSGWLPWVLTFSRSAVFQFYAVVLTPFAAVGLALVLASFARRPREGDLLRIAGILVDPSLQAMQSRRVSVAVFLGAALVLGLLFWPMWIGMPVEQWFAQLHFWLPGWV